MIIGGGSKDTSTITNPMTYPILSLKSSLLGYSTNSNEETKQGCGTPNLTTTKDPKV